MKLKTKRFVIEYANWKIDELERIENADERLEKQRQVSKYAWACQYGFSSIEETMRGIANI
jgi:hypothetical protein